MESDKAWVHKPDSAISQSTKSVLTVLGALFLLAMVVGIFILKSRLSG